MSSASAPDTVPSGDPDELRRLIEELAALGGAEVDSRFDAGSARRGLLACVSDTCRRAFGAGDVPCEFAVHAILARLYGLHVTLQPPQTNSAESSSVLCAIRNTIEEHFLADQERQIPSSILEQMPDDPWRYETWLLDLIHRHSAFRHPVYFDHLKTRATYEDLRFFLTQESTVDASTDDMLALMQIGTSGTVKLEMGENYWDEIGNGDELRMHSVLFANAIRSFGIDLTQTDVGFEPQALACGNLQLMFALRRYHFYKAIGYFAAVEYMAPERFRCLMEAWRRNGAPLAAARYHIVHVEIDVDHAQRWFRRVIGPTVEKYPNARAEIVRGVLYRLNTSQKYLDAIAPRFPSKTRMVEG